MKTKIIKGSQSNYCATIEEYQSNTSATIKGSQSNWDATIKGDIILKDCVIGNKKTKTSKLIAEFSKDRYWEDCTLTEFIKWLGERKE